MPELSKPATSSRKINKIEIAMLTIVFALVIAGIVICFVNKQWFEDVYTSEDGFIENFTVFPLSVAVVTAIVYLVKLASKRSWMFILCMSVAALFGFFVAGEEISWGQRIFHVESSEFFLENNAQHETNLHNMVVDGEKVNKIVFTWLLGLTVALYLFLLPWLYAKKPGVKRFIDWAGIPVPHRVQIIAAIALFVCIGIIPSSKNSELLELGISSIFLLILLYPQNVAVFRTDKA
ncbi:hypothetical protein DYU05_07190 [Mucilaginibacter terrenus]|uniref:Uncharacterized protein n=1 Tax=Mucilaginibacter terrenus TaxID=2482727 RepID=A0A3E2NWI2_9SPHI|nr:hypothetical protein [Mucilaginibacter terrenus]RFZ85374.1 hypothetical protein DYU05_07190 [Mucilaginibacter terrenus]